MGGWLCCADEMGYVNNIMSRVRFIAGEIEIGVLVVLVLVLILVKLFLRRYLIRPELNSPLVIIYSLILSSVHFVKSSSCKVLNSDSRTVAFLCFLTHMPLVHKNIQSFQIPCWLQSLKVYIVKLLKSSL